jgi:hypothetical protein
MMCLIASRKRATQKPQGSSAVSHKFCALFWQFEFLSEGCQIYAAFARRGSLSITVSANRAYA